jgi:hypothetical protein
MLTALLTVHDMAEADRLTIARGISGNALNPRRRMPCRRWC